MACTIWYRAWFRAPDLKVRRFKYGLKGFSEPRTKNSQLKMKEGG